MSASPTRGLDGAARCHHLGDGFGICQRRIDRRDVDNSGFFDGYFRREFGSHVLLAEQRVAEFVISKLRSRPRALRLDERCRLVDLPAVRKQLLASGEQTLWPEDHQRDQRQTEEEVLVLAQRLPADLHRQQAVREVHDDECADDHAPSLLPWPPSTTAQMNSIELMMLKFVGVTNCT